MNIVLMMVNSTLANIIMRASTFITLDYSRNSFGSLNLFVTYIQPVSHPKKKRKKEKKDKQPKKNLIIRGNDDGKIVNI